MSTRLYCSKEEWSRLMEIRPRTGGGCMTPSRETEQTCITQSIDPDVANYLRRNGVRTEYVRPVSN